MIFLRRFVAFAAFWTAFLLISSCGGRQKTPSTPASVPTELADAQKARAVEVETYCTDADGDVWTISGSGVAIDATHVITARHVADCGPTREYIAAVGETADGQLVLMSVESYGKGGAWKLVDDEWKIVGADTAKLVAAMGIEFKGIEPPRLGEIEYDEVGDAPICIVTMRPQRVRACGLAYGTAGGRIYAAYPAVGGNSGSATYNEDGELAGVVTHSIPCLADDGKDAACGSIIDARIREWEPSGETLFGDEALK